VGCVDSIDEVRDLLGGPPVGDGKERTNAGTLLISLSFVNKETNNAFSLE
jgi:hypothetical protein